MKLVIYAKGRAEEIALEGSMCVGRGPACKLCLHDPSVSTRHAQITIEDDKATIADLNSTNGTFVNEEKIGERVLADSDRIRLGSIILIYSCGETTAGGDGPAEESQILAAPIEGESEAGEDEAPTPVDESFAPDEAQPDSPKPELLSREGKWYLREKTTGKEVEIVPVRKGRPGPSPAEVTGTVKDFMHANTLAAAIAILVVGGIFAFVLRTILIVPPPPPGSWTFAKYSNAIRRSVVEIDAAEYGRAEYFLSMAVSKYRDSDLAEILIDLTGVFKDPKKKSSMRDVHRVLTAVGKYAGKDFSDISAWAGRHQKKIKREHRNEELYEEAQGLINGGQFKDAATILGKIPESSTWYGKAQTQIEQISSTISGASLSMADEAIAKEEWKTAVDHLAEAHRSGAKLVLVKEKMEMCRQNERDKGRLAKARDAYANNKLGSALTFLGLIGEKSRYYAEKVALLTQIKLNQVMVDAKVLYDRGDWKGALQMLATVDDPSCAQLIQHINALKKAYDAAEKAYEEKRMEEAITLWDTALALEPDGKNFFHLQLKQRLAEWKGKPEKIAELFFPKAEAAEAKGDYVTMRKWLAECLRLVPDYKQAKDKLATLKEDGQNLFQKAMNLQDKEPLKAIRLFQQIIDMLPADNPYSRRAQEEIKLLKEKSKPKTE